MKGVCVVVLGMHRSGTSAVAGALSRAGVYFGESLLPAASDNPKGFYEHLDLLQADEDMLAALGSSYDDPNPLEEGWHESNAVRPIKERIKGIIRRDFGDQALFGFKDPRVAALLPLYLDIFRELGLDARFVICERSPYEVARSLRVRNGFSYRKSLDLWAKHVDTIGRWVIGHSFSRVRMDDFVTEPRRELERLARELDLQLLPVDVWQADVELFIEPSLKHQSIDMAGFIEVVTREFEEAEALSEDARIRFATALTEAEAKLLVANEAREAVEKANSISIARAEIAEAHLSALRAEQKHLLEVLAKRDEKINNAETLISRLNEGVLAIGAERDVLEATLVAERDALEAALAAEREAHDSANRTIAHRDNRVIYLESRLRETDDLRILLHRAEATLGAIHRSLTWRVLAAFQRLIDAILPLYTKRRGLYDALIRKVQGGASRRIPKEPEVAPAARPAMPIFPNGVDVLFVNHEESLTGAPRILFEVARGAKPKRSIAVVSKSRGSMSDQFSREFGDFLIHPYECFGETERHELARLTLEKIRPRMVYVNSIVAYEYAYEARELGIPVIFHVHEIGAAFDIAIPRERHPEFADSADMFIAVSESTKESLIVRMGVAPERIEIIHEFVCADDVAQAVTQASRREVDEMLGIASDAPVVLAMGTFDRRKGADLFVKAAEKALKRRPDIKFVWVGRGPHAHEAIADTYDAYRDRFIHVPETSNPFPYLARADVFFLASREDPFPLVVLEAMSLGKTVVAFAGSGGAPEAIDGCGVLVQGFSAARAADAVVDLLRDTERRSELGSKAQVRQALFEREQALVRIEVLIERFKGDGAHASIQVV